MLFYNSTLSTREIELYIIGNSKYDLQSTFDQYLRTVDIPVLEYSKKGDKLWFRWADCIYLFNMPVELNSKTSSIKIFPTKEWNYIEINPSERVLRVYLCL